MYKFDSVKSARFFRGVGSYTPNSGVLGGVGWDPVLAKQWQSVLCQWSRMRAMSEHRLNYKIFMWSEGSDCFGRWGTSVFSENTAIFNNCRTKLINGVRRENARQGSGYNKLRLYRCLKSETKPKTTLNV